jgi:hypothetical protein
MANVDDDDYEVSETIPDLEEPHDNAAMKLVRPVMKPLTNWILCKYCRKDIIPQGAVCKCGGSST